MKRNHLFLATTLTIFITLFSFISPVFAQGGRSIKLVGVNHWNGKGVVFKFEVTGEFSPAELRGFARIGDHEFGLDCNFNDDGLLVCVAGNSIGDYVGQSVIVFLNGQAFYAQIPVKKILTPPQYCYDIQGLMTDDFEGFVAAMEGEEADPLTLLDTYWYPAVVGNHCTDDEPQTGDFIDFDHPYENQLDALFGSDPEGEAFDITMAIFVGPDVETLGATEEIDACISTIPSYYGLIRLMTCTIPK